MVKSGRKMPSHVMEGSQEGTAVGGRSVGLQSAMGEPRLLAWGAAASCRLGQCIHALGMLKGKRERREGCGYGSSGRARRKKWQDQNSFGEICDHHSGLTVRYCCGITAGSPLHEGTFRELQQPQDKVGLVKISPRNALQRRDKQI